MSWLIIALLGPISHGFANIVDNYLSNKLFKNVSVLIFYTCLLNLLFIPIAWFIDPPHLLPLATLPFVVLIAACEIFYMFPYYKALQAEDTSIVTSLFDIGKIFVPILAFFIVGEKLHPIQYAGFLLIVCSSAALTFDSKHPLRLNRAFFYMLGCSLILSIETVLYKYVFESVSWGTGFIWAAAISFLIALSFLVVPSLRLKIKNQAGAFRKNIGAFIGVEALSFAGSAAATYAISLVPVTLVESVGSLQSFIVLAYALLLKRFFPNLFKEEIDRRSVAKKSILFLFVLIGVILVIK